VELEWDPRIALGVVLAAGGYPLDYRKGDVISGIDAINDSATKVFHAGTRLDDQGNVCTDGGRVLCVVGLGDDVLEAQRKAYSGVEKIGWDRVYYRKDIGHRAINRGEFLQG